MRQAFAHDHVRQTRVIEHGSFFYVSKQRPLRRLAVEAALKPRGSLSRHSSNVLV
jgi:hypothetical protein